MQFALPIPFRPILGVTDQKYSFIIADFIRYGEFSKTSKEILNLFSLPADFENIPAEKLNLLLAKVTKKHFAEDKLKQSLKFNQLIDFLQLVFHTIRKMLD